MIRSATSSRIIKVRLCNSLPVDRELWIEPLGDMVSMPAGSTMEIVLAQGPGDVSEVEVTDASFLVHGWALAISALTEDGRSELIWGADPTGGLEEVNEEVSMR